MAGEAKVEPEERDDKPQPEETTPPQPSGNYDPDDAYDVYLQAINLWPPSVRR